MFKNNFYLKQSAAGGNIELENLSDKEIELLHTEKKKKDFR